MNPRERRSSVAFVRELGVRAVRQLEPTIASGVDDGPRMELRQNRLNLNFAYDQTEEINGAISQDGPNFFNRHEDTNIGGVQSAVGRNIRGAGVLLVPDRDIRPRSGHGFEFEVVDNPSRAFRLSGRVSCPEVDEANISFDLKACSDENAELFKPLAQDAGVLIDPNDTSPACRRCR